jgi:hypothetical protein
VIGGAKRIVQKVGLTNSLRKTVAFFVSFALIAATTVAAVVYPQAAIADCTSTNC